MYIGFLEVVLVASRVYMFLEAGPLFVNIKQYFPMENRLFNVNSQNSFSSQPTFVRRGAPDPGISLLAPSAPFPPTSPVEGVTVSGRENRRGRATPLAGAGPTAV
jgi:hypothetical protein